MRSQHGRKDRIIRGRRIGRFGESRQSSDLLPAGKWLAGFEAGSGERLFQTATPWPESVPTVPEPDDRVLKTLLVAENADPGSLQQQRSSDGWPKTAPASPKHSQEVTVCKHNRSPGQFPEVGDHSVSSCGHILDRFPAWAAVIEYIPAGECLVNFRLSLPFEVPVIPLDQSGIHRRFGAESRQITGRPSPLQRADQNVMKLDAGQSRSKRSGFFDPLIIQREITSSGMPPGPSPVGFAVPDQVDFGMW